MCEAVAIAFAFTISTLSLMLDVLFMFFQVEQHINSECYSLPVLSRYSSYHPDIFFGLSTRPFLR
jgi:hypothetical protein